MARPKKNNADYFSHDNDMRNDDKIKALRKNFGHEGYSIRNMLLEKLCKAENFEIIFDDFNVELWSGDFDINKEKLEEIIYYLLKMKLILCRDDDELKKSIIYSQKMIDRFGGLIDKRNRDIERLSKLKQQNKNIIANDNTQSKVNKSKVNKIKDNSNIESKLSIQKQSFGNSEINDLLDLIKKTNNGIIDGTVKEQRQYGNMLLKKLKDFDSVKNGQYTSVGLLLFILQIISKNDFHSHKIAGPKKIFYNLAELMQICRQEYQKQNKNKINEF